MILKTIYRFRVLIIEDNERPFDFYLHIFVQHNEPPQYQDLVERIKHHSKNLINTEDYIITIQKDLCSYQIKNDKDFQQVLKSFNDQAILEVKLFRKTKKQYNNINNINNDSVPVLKPFFSRPTIDTTFRRDSGIFLPDGPNDRQKSSCSPNNPLRLPAISPLLYNDNRLISPHDKDLPLTPLSPIHPTPASPSTFIKLPALSSVVPPPIHPVVRSYLDKPANKGMKRACGSQLQFICEYVVDPSTKKICCQTFQRSYDLSRHQNIHLKNRPFCQCHQCGKKFTRLDALRRHERIQNHSSKHDKQKTYQSQPV